ncbi:hypothetical protein R0K17_21635, partial [Planococcus sp. SIMBA_143]
MVKLPCNLYEGEISDDEFYLKDQPKQIPDKENSDMLFSFYRALHHWNICQQQRNNRFVATRVTTLVF